MPRHASRMLKASPLLNEKLWQQFFLLLSTSFAILFAAVLFATLVLGEWHCDGIL